MPSSLYVPILIAGMLITGSSNSLWSKYQDMQCVENCDDPNARTHILFEQPVWQTLQMFLGEMLCFLPVIYAWAALKLKARNQPHHAHAHIEAALDEEEDTAKSSVLTPTHPLTGWKVLLLWLPAACDLTGTTLMNVGLLYTPVSIYQMTRGALVLFVGTLSVVFLRRKLWLYQWLSLLIVMAGVSLVGYSGSLIRDTMRENINALMSGNFRALGRLAEDTPGAEPEVTKVFIGVLFILFAQIFSATQFVVEEKILGHYTVAPLVAVGFEGLFGVLSILILLPLLPLLAPSHTGPDQSPYAMWFDLPRGWHQIISTPTVLYSSVAIAFSISFFNFFGLSVTRHVSATVRSLTDTCRTLCIWIISLGLGWEKLVWPVSMLQVVGFGLLVYGTFTFNNLVNAPSFLRPHVSSAGTTPRIVVTTDEERALLAEEGVDETQTLPAGLGEGRGFDVVVPKAPSES
ncbi:hypothetical protein JAAARDRAFT_127293 [Jaapia argillacea MUCL 33604]|uniref:EamA domain-containing protein n=1 Tax=Jaapia argillacea MUCL 33604 TaxID=933084 RepID=A0A067PX98_9AGAM|nr:hypothetical protein JAAARDRAFT_127293 [Jaapia argillacea MUCL 33604]